jgi:hypothetical protein
MKCIQQLKYYINLGCPPIRRPVQGDEPFMRPEVGFNPSWFHYHCQIEFSEKWHQDVSYRFETYRTMLKTIRQKFPGYNIGQALEDRPPDLLTGIHGIGIIDLIFGRPLQYFADKWPVATGRKMDEAQIAALTVPDFRHNRFVDNLFNQIDAIYKLTGSVFGYLNWQGNLNTAFRFRGDSIFTDLLAQPQLAEKLLDVISETYIRGVKLVYQKQREYGIENNFASIANCTVNMAGPAVYGNSLLKYDRKIAAQFPALAVHNCAWTITPYIGHYKTIANIGYIDMGIDSDLRRVRESFPRARRNCLYKSIDLKNKSRAEIRSDLEFIANNLAPCDLGLPDIEYDVPADKIMYVMDLCAELSESVGTSNAQKVSVKS